MKRHRMKSTRPIEFSIYCLMIGLVGNAAHGAGRSRGPILPTLIDSVAELQTHMNASNSHFVMTPGVYFIDAAGVAAGEYGNPFLWIRGDDNTWDFTGVTLVVNTNFYRAHGYQAVQILWVIGNQNYIKGLTIQDVGNEGPRRGSG